MHYSIISRTSWNKKLIATKDYNSLRHNLKRKQVTYICIFLLLCANVFVSLFVCLLDVFHTNTHTLPYFLDSFIVYKVLDVYFLFNEALLSDSAFMLCKTLWVFDFEEQMENKNQWKKRATHLLLSKDTSPCY